MSMDWIVFVDHVPTLTVVDFQKAIDESHMLLKLNKDVDLAQLGGFFPALLDKKRSGFYYSNTDMAEFIDQIPGINIVHSTAAYDYSFGHFSEDAYAYYLAAALVASFNGRAFDAQSGKWVMFKDLKATADELE